MVLCVWTAIHLNIPSASENDKKSAIKILKIFPTAKQIRYLLMALFMPELVSNLKGPPPRTAADPSASMLGFVNRIQSMAGEERPD